MAGDDTSCKRTLGRPVGLYRAAMGVRRNGNAARGLLSLALDVWEFLHPASPWHPSEPIRWQDWAARFAPELGPASQFRRWLRMLNRLEAAGYHVTRTPDPTHRPGIDAGNAAQALVLGPESLTQALEVLDAAEAMAAQHDEEAA